MKDHEEDSQLLAVELKVMQEMAAAGVVHGAEIRVAENDKGFIVVLDLGQGKAKRVLGRARGKGTRYFRTMETAATTLLDCGITRFHGDTSAWRSRTQPRGSTTRGKVETRAAASA